MRDCYYNSSLYGMEEVKKEEETEEEWLVRMKSIAKNRAGALTNV